jgi:hypothetical protein
LHADVPSHKSPSQFLIATKNSTTIASPQISAAMTFSVSIMQQESVLNYINNQQSFEALPLKPNSWRKKWVHTTESHPIMKSLGMNRPVECRRSLPEHDVLI